MIAYCCNATGWSAKQTWHEMTFPLLTAFEEEWKLRPPVAWLVAGFVGYEPPKQKVYMDANAARDFMRLTGGKIPGVAQIGMGVKQ